VAAVGVKGLSTTRTLKYKVCFSENKIYRKG